MATSVGTSANKDCSTIPVPLFALLLIFFIMQVMRACYKETAYYCSKSLLCICCRIVCANGRGVHLQATTLWCMWHTGALK